MSKLSDAKRRWWASLTPDKREAFVARREKAAAQGRAQAKAWQERHAGIRRAAGAALAGLLLWGFPAHSQVLQSGIVSPNHSACWVTQGVIKDCGGGAGTGTVLSVGLSMPPVLFSVLGSPVTSIGTFTVGLIPQGANKVFAGPLSGGAGAPSFRSLVGADMPFPGPASLGGVSAAGPITHLWVNAISNLGVPGLAQIDYSDLTGTVPTASIPDGSITNTKLAPMPSNTLKGNNGGLAAPIDLTGSQATAMLTPFVGDSGGGGTQGLVPAPAAGDAAAGKVLGAAGGWVLGGGGGGGLSGMVAGQIPVAATPTTVTSSMPFTNSGAPNALVATGAGGLIAGTLLPLPGVGVLNLGGVQSLAPVPNKFLTGLDSVTGLLSATQPACPNLSDAGTGCSTNVGTVATQNANNVAFTGGTITGLPTPTNPADAATKSYVDSTAVTGNPHAPVAYTTGVTGAGGSVLPNTPTYNNGAGTLTDSTAGAVLVVGGQNVTVVGTRVLVGAQAAPAQNGIYTLTTAGSAGTIPWVLTRATDFNTVAAGNVATGAYTFVSAAAYGLTPGTNDANSYAMNQTAAITIGTTAITWVQINTITTYTPSPPITLAGSVFGFQAIPATSVPANTTGGSATPSGNIVYGTGCTASTLVETGGAGTIAAACLPNPSASTKGGIQSIAAVASKWINTISTSGVPSATRPACPDLSDSGAGCSTTYTGSTGITLTGANFALSNIAATSVPVNAAGTPGPPTTAVPYSATPGANVIPQTGAGTTLASGFLPLPTTGARGGVKAVTCGASTVVNVISAVDGGPTCVQLGFSDLTGQATLAQFPTIANNTALGNVSGGSAVPVALSTTQLTTLCNLFTATLSGCVPSRNATVTATVTSAGYTQAAATALTTQFSFVTSAASGTGVALPTAAAGLQNIVCNTTAVQIEVWPASGATINGGTANVPQALAATTCALSQASSTTAWSMGFTPYAANQLGAGVYVSTAGTDSGTCPLSAPCATIGYASGQAGGGGTVWVWPGQYVEEPVITVAGLTFRSIVKWGAEIVPTSAAGTQKSGWNVQPSTPSTAAKTTIRDFYFNGADGPNSSGNVWSTGLFCRSRCDIIGNKIINIANGPFSQYTNGGAGIGVSGFYGSSTGSITGNFVWNIGINDNGNKIHGIYNQTTGYVIQNNIVGKVLAGYGIETWHGSSNLIVANNLILNSTHGIQISNGDQTNGEYIGPHNTTVVFNNIVQLGNSAGGNGPAYIGINDGSATGYQNCYSNNLVAMTGGWVMTGNHNAHVNDIQGTARFVNYQADGSGDYHLADGSWGINQGIPTLCGAAGPSTDFDGNARPAGATDVGPYQRGVGSGSPQYPQDFNGSLTYSGLNVNQDTVTAVATNASPTTAIGSNFVGTGYYYFEAVLNFTTQAFAGVGVVNINAPSNVQLGATVNGYEYRAGGTVFRGGGSTSTGAITWTTGTRVDVAVDLVGCQIWARTHGGNWNNNATFSPGGTGGNALANTQLCNAAAPVGITLAITQNDNGDTATIYAQPSEWTDTLPTGYGPLNGPPDFNPQRPFNVPISTVTFTPPLWGATNFELDLVSGCPCTLANPLSPLRPGQRGVIEVHNTAAGGKTIGTWGTSYLYPGGTAAIALTGTAAAVDYFPYYVNAAGTGIVLQTMLANPTH